MTAAAGLARGADRVLNWILYLILLLFLPCAATPSWMPWKFTPVPL